MNECEEYIREERKIVYGIFDVKLKSKSKYRKEGGNCDIQKMRIRDTLRLTWIEI